jgi:hypothetical protein
MKIKENFVLRKIAGTYAVLALAEATVNFNGLLTLNESGVMLWKLIEQGSTREDMALALTEEYEVSYEEALADVNEYLEKLNKAGCLEL